MRLSTLQLTILYRDLRDVTGPQNKPTNKQTNKQTNKRTTEMAAIRQRVSAARQSHVLGVRPLSLARQRVTQAQLECARRIHGLHLRRYRANVQTNP